MKNKVIFILLFLFLLVATKSFATLNNFVGKITKVVDGDTIIVNGETKVRFACVDTYESSVNKHLKMQMEKYNMTQEEVLKLGTEQKNFLTSYEKFYFPYDSRSGIIFKSEISFGVSFYFPCDSRSGIIICSSYCFNIVKSNIIIASLSSDGDRSSTC